MIESNVGVFSVFGAQSRKICALRKYRLCMLYFIDENKTWGIISGKPGSNLFT